MSDMLVTFISPAEINSDLGVVNAARVSLNKRSQWDTTHKPECEVDCTRLGNCDTSHFHDTLSIADAKLISYLAKNSHWTPFAHSRLYFEIDWMGFATLEELHFYKNFNSAGFAWIDDGRYTYIKGSVYAWLSALQHMPLAMAEMVHCCSYAHYPISTAALTKDRELEPFSYSSHTVVTSEDFITQQTQREPQFYKLLTATMLVTVPVSVAHQMREPTIGIVYSDIVTQDHQQTAFYMTATLHRWSQWLSLRLDSHVQQETQEIAGMIRDSLSSNYPQFCIQ